MLETTIAREKFKSLMEYEDFHLRWATACYRLNPTEQNKERLEYSMKVFDAVSKQQEV